MSKSEPGLDERPASTSRGTIRRNRLTAVGGSPLVPILVCVALAAPGTGAAQDDVPTDTVGQLRSSLDGLLLRDGLTPQQVAVTKEMQTWLDALREEDLNPLHARLLKSISSGLRHSDQWPRREVVGWVASVVDLVVDDDLTDEEAAQLEAKLLEEPDDTLNRTKLVRHYHMMEWEESRRAHGEHVVWLIENAPYAYELRRSGRNWIDRQSASDAYDAGREAWRRHVEREPDNPVFLARYARFLTRTDPSLSTELLERAHRADARNPWRAQELGHAYLRAAMRPDEKAYDPRDAERALRQFDRAYGLADNDIMRNSLLQNRASAAFSARKYDLAKQHAQAMLDTDSAREPDGDLMHWGNTILGRIALIEGDVARAKEHLLESGKVPTSPVLGSFGPSMALASELLALGQRGVVRDYFDLCAVFWEAEELNSWRAMLDAGQTPDFGNSAWSR